MPKVSVVLPCYNGSQWIGSAIESVLTQKYENFELLVVNDGSTDNTKEIVDSYLHDERVRYIYQKNKGFSAAINRGINESKGSFIGFIGQDDEWMPNKLKLQVKFLNEDETLDLVHSNYYKMDSEGKIFRSRYTRTPNFTSREKIVEYLFRKNFIGFETVLVRKDCFLNEGLFDERMIAFSDHDMWLRLASVFKIGYIDIPLVKKREHEYQLSKVHVETGIRDEFLLVQKALKRYPFLETVVKKKLSSLYYWWGLVLLRKGNQAEARRRFLLSIQYQPWKPKVIAAYLAPTPYLTIWHLYVKSKHRLHKALK